MESNHHHAAESTRQAAARATATTPFRAGWARVDITPPIGVPLSGYYVSEGRSTCAVDILDRLEAKALVLDDGASRVAIVTLDVISLPEPFCEHVRERLRATPDLVDTTMVLAATHNHSGPTLSPLPVGPNLYPGETHSAYVSTLVDDIVTAIQLASTRLAPASVAVGRGHCEINVNRRETLPDGRLRPLPFLGQNRAGPVDHQVLVLRVASDDGRQALLVNYPCHAVVLGPNVEIAGDYPGAMQRFVEAAYGGSTMAMFTTGAHGDINPIIHPGSYADAARLGRILAAEVVRAAEQAEAVADLTLTTFTAPLLLPTRAEVPLDEEGVQLAHLLAKAEALRAATPLPTLIQEEMDYAVEMMRHHKRRANPHGIPIAVTGVGIGTVGIVTIPGELFSAIGSQIKAASPFPHTLLLGLANGANGYLPDHDAYAVGGFEVQATAFAAGSAEAFRDHALTVLQGLQPALAGPR